LIKENLNSIKLKDHIEIRV